MGIDPKILLFSWEIPKNFFINPLEKSLMEITTFSQDLPCFLIQRYT